MQDQKELVFACQNIACLLAMKQRELNLDGVPDILLFVFFCVF